MGSQSRPVEPHSPAERDEPREHARRTKRPPKCSNALQAGIMEFLSSPASQALLDQLGLTSHEVTSALPKRLRFIVYEPLLLLPANTFQTPPKWQTFYKALTPHQQNELYASIAKHCRRLGVTHIAINAPIALTIKGEENRIRSPGLVPLYGRFGEAPTSGTVEDNTRPNESELERAFWVRTSQNGIVQTWAPFFTMFSRGNITEKARILGQTFPGLDEDSLQGQSIPDISVVDMYAGIGYFVFSYLKRGIKRVWGFELNGWSVEGLRRGCEANGWGCRVVRLQQDGGLDVTIEELADSLSEDDRVVIFHGDNQYSAGILNELQRLMEHRGTWRPVRHVNLGLLPSSRMSWENACRVLDSRGGWLHLHENVDLRQAEEMKADIIAELSRLRQLARDGRNSVVECCHLEHVKTYAPGIIHFVFDMRIT